MSKISGLERERALTRLHEIIKPGDTIHCVLRSVSSSGMSRNIDLYKIDGPDPFWLSRLVTMLGIGTWNENKVCIHVGGCGMDMGHHLVYELSRAMWPDGHECIGKGCHSNDHTNGDRNYEPHHHRNGGYCLQHRWL